MTNLAKTLKERKKKEKEDLDDESESESDESDDDEDEGGEFHDQGDANSIVIRGQLRGHNDTPFGRPTPSRPIGRLGFGRPQGVFGGLSYY
jgi:hypothetical protein